MKIGVDAASLADNNNHSGNFQLSYCLLKSLSKLDKTNQYLLYSYRPISKKLLTTFGSNFKNKVLRPKKFWMQFRLGLELLIRPVDVFLGLNQALPFLTFTKSVVVVLDLAFELYPETFDNAPKLSWQTKKAVAKAVKIIAISESTKRDMKRLYQIPQNKIKVIYPG